MPLGALPAAAGKATLQQPRQQPPAIRGRQQRTCAATPHHISMRERLAVTSLGLLLSGGETANAIVAQSSPRRRRQRGVTDDATTTPIRFVAARWNSPPGLSEPASPLQGQLLRPSSPTKELQRRQRRGSAPAEWRKGGCHGPRRPRAPHGITGGAKQTLSAHRRLSRRRSPHR